MKSTEDEMTKRRVLTGLLYGDAFFNAVEECRRTETASECSMMAIGIEHFRLYNKIHGRKEGDALLDMIAEALKAFQKEHGGVVGYLGGDDFGVFAKCEKEFLKELRTQIKGIVRQKCDTIGYLPAFGVYNLSNCEVPAATMYDYAKTALTHVFGNYVHRMCEYNSDMDDGIEKELRILSEVQEGLEKDEFTFFVQPQCDITRGKVVGGESLVRWNHREEGLVSPGIFVPVLEKNGFIADLDRVVWDKVCRWQRECLDKGYEPVPLSINVSRIDIFSMDVPKYLFDLLDKYDLPEELIKVEITESAYAENTEKIIETVNALRERGIVVMMDDFGSGYSSLNMLKSVPVDVLKMDMRFLEMNEQEEEKGIGILDSVINMAKQMRVPIVVEGVENQSQENHLLKMGCRYAQGYYYYKPMPTMEFEENISDPRNVDHEGFWCRQAESVHVREFLDVNLFNDVMANNILGPAAFYDVHENHIEITRVNEQYFQLAGISTQEEEDYHKRFWNHVRDDDRQLLVTIFEKAYDNPANGASGFIHYLRADEKVLWVYIRVFYLREKEGHKLFYASLTDMTSIENKTYDMVSSIEVPIEELTDKQRAHIEKYCGDLPGGYGIGKVLLDESGNPVDYEIVYANKELGRISGGSIEKLRYLISRTFSEKQDEFIKKAYQAAYLGKRVEMSVYSKATSRYLDITMYQYQYGYVSCVLSDVTHSHIYEKALDNVMLSFREVYFLHLQDNYCRMLYPDDNHMLERGNYESIVSRHFRTGRIVNRDEDSIRRFLSLENLKRVLLKQDEVEYTYQRNVKPGGQEWCLTTIAVSERNPDGTPKTAIITIRSVEALIREKEDNRRQNMAAMMSNMSEGFFVYQADDKERILYANPPVLKLFGCRSMEEFRELVHDSFQGVVYPEDLNRVQWEIHEQIKHSERKMDYICYRIIRKDGEIRWIDDCGHLENAKDDGTEKLFYVFVSDITDTMTDVQKQKLIAQSKCFDE